MINSPSSEDTEHIKNSFVSLSTEVYFGIVAVDSVFNILFLVGLVFFGLFVCHMPCPPANKCYGINTQFEKRNLKYFLPLIKRDKHT